jgi:hypothetical protein
MAVPQRFALRTLVLTKREGNARPIMTETKRKAPAPAVAISAGLALVSIAAPALAQQSAAVPNVEALSTRIEQAVAAQSNNPRLKGLSPADRKGFIEFVAGNMLFVLLHEMGHAVVAELRIPVLGKDEDAADAFAATRLIRLQNGFSEQVVAEAAKGWFMSDRRDKKEGDAVPYYDEHGLDLQRAYQFVCYLVGADPEKFRALADETKLPKDRQTSCKNDYSRALNNWDAALKPYRRAPDQPKIRIDVSYGDGKEKQLEAIAEAFRHVKLLEPVAEFSADQLAWPTPFTLEMETCGFINAAWTSATHKLTLCYELAADFGDLYRSYGLTPKTGGKISKKRKSK